MSIKNIFLTLEYTSIKKLCSYDSNKLISSSPVSRGGLHEFATFRQKFIFKVDFRTTRWSWGTQNISTESLDFVLSNSKKIFEFWSFFKFLGPHISILLMQKVTLGPTSHSEKWRHSEKMSIFQSWRYVNHNHTTGKETSLWCFYVPKMILGQVTRTLRFW